MEGWIKLHRKFLDWEWYQDGNTMRVFLHLLLTANFEDKKWNGMIIRRGQLVTGRKKLSEELQLSERAIRTCITRLKTTSELSVKTTNKYSIITICNYESYQEVLTTNDQQNDQQAVQQTTTTKEIKKKEDPPKVPPKQKFDVPENLDTPKFRKVWLEEWVPYRKERNLSTYKPRGLKAALSGLDRMADGDVTVAIKIIRQSIEKNWQGLFELKDGGKPQARSSGYRSKTKLNYNKPTKNLQDAQD
jgi:hypothetical protein